MPAGAAAKRVFFFEGERVGGARNQFRAIVIDDMEFCRDLLREFLESRDYQVLTFPDVTSCPLFSARDLACQKHQACADFLLLDNLMPRMNGLDFLELQMQGNCLFSINSKAIISASWLPADLARARQLGVKVFHKPYHFDQLGAWLDGQEKLIAPDRVLVNSDRVMGMGID